MEIADWLRILLWVLGILQGVIAISVSFAGRAIWTKVSSLEKGDRATSERVVAIETMLESGFSSTLRLIQETLKAHGEVQKEQGETLQVLEIALARDAGRREGQSEVIVEFRQALEGWVNKERGDP